MICSEQSNSGKKTIVFHFLYSGLSGAAFGVINSLQEVTARKSFFASGLQITLLTLAFPVAVLLSVPITAYMQAGKGIRQFLLYSATIRLFSMIAMLWAKTPGQYIALIFLFYLPEAVLGPAINYILGRNYSGSVRGKRFGIANSILYAASLATALCAGKIMDIDQEYFRQIYIAVGIFGATASLMLIIVPVRGQMNNETWRNPIKKQ